MSKSLTNQIRQVIVNELELSRDFIRKEAEKFIQETVDRHINNIMNNGFIDKAISKAFSKMIAAKYSNYTAAQNELEILIENKIKQVVLDYLKENLKIIISTKEQDEKKSE